MLDLYARDDSFDAWTDLASIYTQVKFSPLDRPKRCMYILPRRSGHGPFWEEKSGRKSFKKAATEEEKEDRLEYPSQNSAIHDSGITKEEE